MNEVGYGRTVFYYIVGFGLCLALTLAAYYIVTAEVLTGIGIIATVGALAFVQMIVQLVFFLHLGSESRPRWRLVMFAFMSLILLIVVAGSIWIMYHLNYNMMDMSADEKTRYMMTQRDKGF